MGTFNVPFITELTVTLQMFYSDPYALRLESLEDAEEIPILSIGFYFYCFERLLVCFAIHQERKHVLFTKGGYFSFNVSFAQLICCH